MNLRDAIEQAIALGHNDPAAIAQFVLAGHGEQIVLSEIDAAAYVADAARKMLGSNRRSAIRALARAETKKKDVMLADAWLPGLGWVRLGDFTLDLWDRLIGSYRSAEAAFARYADWCEQMRARVEEVLR